MEVESWWRLCYFLRSGRAESSLVPSISAIGLCLPMSATQLLCSLLGSQEVAELVGPNRSKCNVEKCPLSNSTTFHSMFAEDLQERVVQSLKEK